MIGVCIPAHDESAEIAACLRAVRRAAARIDNEPVRIVVVADACTDDTESIARAQGCDVLRTDGRCVGAARAAGVSHLLALGARWLCCTDADSRVPANWITAQLACDSDAVCGTICVGDWREHPPHVAMAFASHYQSRDGHRHIHGANLGFSADAYRRAGGFASVVAHEDVRLVQCLQDQQANIAWVRDPRVVTSARRLARAPEGFAAWLNARWADGALGATAVVAAAVAAAAAA